MRRPSTEGRILRAIKLQPTCAQTLGARLSVTPDSAARFARKLVKAGYAVETRKESDYLAYPSAHWQITEAGLQSLDSGVWDKGELVRDPPDDTRVIPIGDLHASSLRGLALHAIQRMRKPAGIEWMLWRDDVGQVYLEPASSKTAERIARRHVDWVISHYRQGDTLATRVGRDDVIADLEAARDELTIGTGGLASRSYAGIEHGVHA